MNHKDYYKAKAAKHSGVYAYLTAVLVIAILFAIGSRAFAEEKTISFIPPTQCENGDNIGETEVCPALSEYRLSCATSDGPPYDTNIFFEPPADNKYIHDFEPGEYWCVLAVRHSANESYSGWSNEVNFMIAVPQTVPNPVEALSVD